MKNPIYPKISSNIPGYIKEEYPKLHELVISYFKWLEQDRNFINALITFHDNNDCNNQVKPYIDFIKNELGWNFNIQLKIDDKTLIALLKDFYLSRGSDKSFKLLYRILFDTDINIVYPRDDLFKLSDNSYIIEHEIVTSANNFTNYYQKFQVVFNQEALSISLLGLTSGLFVTIDEIVTMTINNDYFLKIKFSKTNNNFIPFEDVNIIINNEVFTEKVFAKLSFDIDNAGYGYKRDDELLVTLDPSLLKTNKIIGKLLVDSVTKGGIDKVKIDKYLDETGSKHYYSGIKYATGDKVRAISPFDNGHGFEARVVTTDVKQAKIALTKVDGIIHNMTIAAPEFNGRGYIVPPKLIIKHKSPTAPPILAEYAFDAMPISKDYIGDIRIHSRGFYTQTSQPVTILPLTISAPNSSPNRTIQATGNAYIENGEIVKIVITNPGKGYYSVPTIRVIQKINGVVNQSALLFPIMMGDITNDHIRKISGGQGYSINDLELVFDEPVSTQPFAKTPDCTLEIHDGTLIPKVIDPGYGYDSIPTHTLALIDGENFNITLDITDTKVNIVNYVSGKNYTGNPTITIADPTNYGRIEYIDIIHPGYDYTNLDNITLEITSQAGSGARLSPISTSIGKILKFKEQKPFYIFDHISDRTSPLYYETKFKTNNTAKIVVNDKICVNRSNRYSENNFGLLGVNGYLHDSYFYQQFSYLTRSEYPTPVINELINDLLHPAGYLKFNKFKVTYLSELDILDDTDFRLTKVVNLLSKFGYNAFYANIEPALFGIVELVDSVINQYAYTNYIEINNEVFEFNINNHMPYLFNSSFNTSIGELENYFVNNFEGTSNFVDLNALDCRIIQTD